MLRLIELFRDQRREPGQIRSFVQHLGVSDQVIGRVPGETPRDDNEEVGSEVT